MADNTELNAGTGGDTISTDELAGGVKVQRVKIQYGVDGSATDVSDSNPLPIDDAGGSITVDGTVGVSGTVTVDGSGVTQPVSGTVTANLSATDNAVLDAIAASVAGTLTVDNGGTFAVQAAQSGSWSATVTGAAAENAAASGNPVLVGGRYDSSARTLGTGDAGALAVNASGQLLVEIAAGAGSGGTAAADDADFTAASTSGTPVMGAYQSSPTAVTDGDLGIVGITANRELKVSVTSYADSQTDDAAFTPGTDSVAMVGALFDDTATDTVDEGDGGALRMTNRRALYTTFETPAGDSPWDDTNDALQVNVVAGSTAGTEYTEDAAAPANPVGPTSMMQRDDALGGLTPIEGDWSHQFCNANGALWTAIDGTVAATQSGTWNITNISGTVSLPTGAATAANQSTANTALSAIQTAVETLDNAIAGTEMQVDVVTSALPTGAATSANQSTMITALQLIDNPVLAHDSAVGSTQTMMAGARATNNIEGLTQVAANDGTRLTADLNGCLVTRPHSTLEEHISERVSNTDGASTAFTNFAAGGAGVHNYVMNVTITNTSATDGYVDLRDGTAGSVLWTFPAPANSGATHAFSYPLKGSANTALAYDVSAALTTVYISVNGFQAQG